MALFFNAPLSFIAASGGGFGATGGVEDTTSVSGYKLHTFTSSGTFEVTGAAGDVEILLVGGGGAGGHNFGGGGGAGAVMVSNAFELPVGTYTVTVGAGGTGVGNFSTGFQNSDDGDDTVFTDGSSFTITALGGQSGEVGQYTNTQTRNAKANSGGQGGKLSNPGGYSPSNGTVSWPSGVTGTIYAGNDGGAAGDSGAFGYWLETGGGAGAGADGDPGTTANNQGGGDGGAGVTVTGFAASGLVLAGGGQGQYFNVGQATSSSTDNGGAGNTGGSGGDATANRGGGGGAGSNETQSSAGNGGSGLVVIRYAI